MGGHSDSFGIRVPPSISLVHNLRLMDSHTASNPPPPIFSKLEDLAQDRGYLTYEQFSRIALYDADHGYYTARRQRVGKTPEADFYTSMSLGPMFGKLVVAAIQSLLHEEELSGYTFVEIAAEPETSLLNGVEHSFAQHRIIRLGDPLQVEGRAVVFSNEWLDAQPFHRLVFKEGTWKEVAIQVVGDDLQEILLDAPSRELQPWIEQLPPQTLEGYHFDVPTGAEFALSQLLSQDWSGLFLTLDYGKTLQELVECTPQGTARAYSRHQQSPDLLAQPGEQDLTCHLCWDWLENLLERNDFSEVQTLRQESLFMRHASHAIRQIMEQATSPQDSGKLKELLHPAHLGHTFQALCGIRAKKH